MNTELKALLKTLFDAFKAGKAAVEKQNFVTAVLPLLYQVAMDIPAASANWANLKAEIAALSGTAQEADLVAYILGNVDGITTDAHAKAILAQSLKLLVDVVEDALALEAAIKSAPASA